MCGPKLHIGGIGGKADIERIKEKNATVIALPQRIDQSVESLAAHLGQVGNVEPGGRPFVKG